MIDAKLILKQPEFIQENNLKRGKEIDINIATELLKTRAKLTEDMQRMQQMSNGIADRMVAATDAEKEILVKKGKAVKIEIKKFEGQLTGIEKNLQAELKKYPNILHGDVPKGKSERQNQEIRTHGEPKKFSFKPRHHIDLATELGLIDMKRAAKASGARFAYIKGDLVLMQLALYQYALSILAAEGFTPIIPPHLVTTESMSAMGYLDHGGEEEIYHMKKDDLVLIGTSEQAIGPMYKDEILKEEDLPLRYAGISSCYRREAGSYGKDTKGILRVHQFDKVEMFSFVDPEKSEEEHKKLLGLQERLMQGLELPYRVMKLCSGDMSSSSACTYDIETWMPSEERYRETHSTSNTTDYQTRRLNTRVKIGGKKQFAHALNGTAFAIGRTLIMIMENYQQKDGSITVPDILRPWMGKNVIKKVVK
jgi:seryl-tRNA synthetase